MKIEPAGEAPRHLSLYHFRYCPYCVDVRRVLSQLRLEVELRNIHERPQYLQELTQARGRKTVPVLRIEEASGQVRWLPESLDIIEYLRSLAGRASSPPPPAATGLWSSPPVVRVLRWVPFVAALGAALVSQPWLRLLLLGLAAAALVRRYVLPRRDAA